MSHLHGNSYADNLSSAKLIVPSPSISRVEVYNFKGIYLEGRPGDRRIDFIYPSLNTQH